MRIFYFYLACFTFSISYSGLTFHLVYVLQFLHLFFFLGSLYKKRKERNSPIFITGGDFALLNKESMEVVFYPPHETERLYLPGCLHFKEMVPGPGERPVPGLSDS